MLLTDEQLIGLIMDKTTPLLKDYDAPTDWYSRDSLVQPCSIDLHIGAIYQPGVEPGKPGSANKPKEELVLKTGQTAIVATKESIQLTAQYAGYGFPPSSISSRALLMTNPGHIDPGYRGTLQFTVINMGKEDYVLRGKDLIVTLLIFKLDAPVKADYVARNPKPGISHHLQANLDLLSPDFVDVEHRATEIAKKTLGLATIILTILTTLVTFGVNEFEKSSSGIDDIKTRLTKTEVANANLAKQLEETKAALEKQLALNDRLTRIETKVK